MTSVSPSIRLLEPGDTQAYGDLWNSAVQEYPQFFRSTIDDDPSGNIPTRFSVDSFTLGAFLQDDLAGILSLERDRLTKLRHKALVFRMFVAPDRAGSGIGRALLEQSIQRALRVPDLRQLYLTVLETNGPAQSLYKSAGFSTFAQEPQAVYNDGRYIDELQMLLVLDSVAPAGASLTPVRRSRGAVSYD